MLEPLPLAVQTAYQDLLDAHLTRAIGDIAGAPFLRDVRGKPYWYVMEREGGRPRARYLGPDSEAMRARIARAKAEREDARAFERRSSLLVAQLRAARLPAPDRQTGALLAAMAKVGVFRLGGTLVGTHAFRLYDAELGVRATKLAPAVTEDVDIASFERLSLALDDHVDPSLAETFDRLGLEPAAALDAKGRSARWRLRGGGAALDFLTPSFAEEEDLQRLEALGVWAQGLHFLNFLIADPIPAVAAYRSGVLVQIPRPERYAIHKLIVAQRRAGPNRAKARKDLLQAHALIEALAQDRPGELADAYEAALANGPRWRETIAASLKGAPETARRLAAATG